MAWPGLGHLSVGVLVVLVGISVAVRVYQEQVGAKGLAEHSCVQGLIRPAESD